MPYTLRFSLLACAMSTVLAASALAQDLKPAPLPSLVSRVHIPYESFKLENGLTVLVHTDRKVPVVAVSIWYPVGSKHEPKGRTGFAHLFEHLMFGGSENVPGEFIYQLQWVGATDANGTTWFDRTNYFETVPTAALDRMLMMESDRMGHLLGAIKQTVLDNQREVVKNEKRQHDNEPYGLVEYEQYENLYPSGHPYHHSTIGSMADLDSAILDDVRRWFTDHYGPNNAVLVLAGDVDVATAKAKVARWFGGIEPGPKIKPVSAPVPTLPAPQTKTIKDQIASTRIYRMWAVPGLDHPDYLPLDATAWVLGGLASSRLDDALVRKQKLAVMVNARAEIDAQAAQFIVQVDVTPGADPGAVAAALDAEIARLIKDGPSADELQRAATCMTAERIRGLERSGGFDGKAPTLAEGLLYNGDPAHYRTELDRLAKLRPADVRAAMARWLRRPVFSLIVEPGERTEGGERRGGFYTDRAARRPLFYADPTTVDNGAAIASAAPADRVTLPEVGALTPLDFPNIERATLKSGIPVYFARRGEVPIVAVRMSFDVGHAADPEAARGTQSLLLSLMNEGTETLDSAALARERDRLGATISVASTADRSWFQLDALSPNLAPSLGLLADIVRRPALDVAELERVRVQQLAAASSEMATPATLAERILLSTLYGRHPYAAPASGRGDPAVVTALSRDALKAFYARWFRPDTATILVVGDTTLDEVVKMLDARFGDWPLDSTPRPVKDFSAVIPEQNSRVILVNRSGAPQSWVMAGQLIDARGIDDDPALRMANDILGAGFASRLNMNLREGKGWTYGASSEVTDSLDRIAFSVIVAVQTDRTGDSLVEIKREIDRFVTTGGVTAEELDWSAKDRVRRLPGTFETGAAVLDGVARIVNVKLPDNYYERISSRYDTMTAADIDRAVRSRITTDGMVWVVVGDAATVKPQLERFGLPVEEMMMAD